MRREALFSTWSVEMAFEICWGRISTPYTRPIFAELANEDDYSIFRIGAKSDGDLNLKMALGELEAPIIQYYDIHAEPAEIKLWLQFGNHLREAHSYIYSAYLGRVQLAYPSKYGVIQFLSDILHENCSDIEYMYTKVIYEKNENNFFYCFNSINFKKIIKFDLQLPHDIIYEILTFLY